MDPRVLAGALAPWFAAHHRDLSWRSTTDPYKIWVSEIMLQQTRVETVERYYARFLERFPDVGTLAAAEQDDVLEQWSGLGYYRRARLLHQGARHVAQTLAGALPQGASELQKIPGIGPYTAGAISAIAFGRAEPLVDGNVARVLSRLRALRTPAEQDAKHKGHWKDVREILEAGEPRVLGQALMELGATVCTPRSPRCDACPVARNCETARLGLQDEIPAPRKKVAQPSSGYVGLLVVWRGKVMLVRRPPTGLLSSMWCVPLLETKAQRPRRPPANAAEKLLGMAGRFEPAPRSPVKHVFTHRIWVVHPWAVHVSRKPRPKGLEVQWLAAGEAAQGGMPTVTRKVLTGL